ncbi:MAG TPA: NADH-quinone oxidoreductase subunit NuoG [Thermodesulfobacteriota bacterium]|nr:NADH-quinone oxidoreductase subunit NuoG [Thermodesulfobacteriota bacterium]
MPKLKIDGLEIEVPKGMKVIEAAAQLSIIIPRFCYHPGLGSVGACRMCAVKFMEGPVKGIQMSCMIDAQDGMVVSTTDEEAVDFRKHVIEWLMMNHPHDCPVCDEGGHCLLQDMTVSGGHGLRRYLGKKRTYSDQSLGVFIQHEMNRCIHCWRCRRFYQEFAGYRDLGAMQIGYRTYFGRYKDGPLESPFSGNLIDLCPTGVYTDKPSRFRGRRWDFVRSPSLCIHCSLGCNLITSVRYRELVRHEARFNPLVNGYFICDRGRYGFHYTDHPERPRRGRIGTEEVALDKAIQAAAEKLIHISQKNGPASVACLGSARSSIENQAMLMRLSRSHGWDGPGYYDTSEMARKVRRAVSRLDDRLAVSMRQMEKVDFILTVGADPVNEAPMLALAMRQAFRNGATVAVIDPRPVFLPFEFEHLPVPPDHLEACLSGLIKGAVDRTAAEKIGKRAVQFYDEIPSDWLPEPTLKDRMVKITEQLRQSRYPVIVCGTAIVSETTPDQVADHALLLHSAKDRGGLFYLMPGANAFGATLLSGQDRSLTDLIESIEKGAVKALILVEANPFQSFPDQQRLRQALDKLEILLVLDYLPSEAARLAHILLPTQTLFEMETCFVNQEGRIQFAPPAHRGGIPVSQISGGHHPPRVFRHNIPGGEPEPAWKILAKLSNIMPGAREENLSLSREELWTWIMKEYPAFTGAKSFEDPEGGVRVMQGQEHAHPFSSLRPPSPEGDSLHLLLVDWTFGTEELAAYSDCIWEVEKSPCLLMHPKDASRTGVADKEKCTLELDGGPLEVEVNVIEGMAPGVIILPKHRQLAWQKVKRWPARVEMRQIRKRNNLAF